MIIGHQKQLNYLKRMAESGKIPHALLFSGQEKLGKKTIALEFISRLFEEPGSKILSHPDFILIEPQSHQIQIDQIRDLAFRLSLKPIKAKRKAAIVDESHSMTREAQNCFLKTLEEPKGNTILILVTQSPNFLLPTIISRCQIIKFYPVKKDEIERYFKNQGGLGKGEGEENEFSSSPFAVAREIEEILEISQGRPGRAVELASSKEKFEFYKKRMKELDEILNSSLSTRFQYAKEISKQENLREILEIWLNYFRNIFIKNCSTSRAIAKGEEENLFSSPSKVEHLKSILQQIQRTIYLISTTNINPRLALEILMLEL
jgi:DNA polymerase-3 subunit delta'